MARRPADLDSSLNPERVTRIAKAYKLPVWILQLKAEPMWLVRLMPFDLDDNPDAHWTNLRAGERPAASEHEQLVVGRLDGVCEQDRGAHQAGTGRAGPPDTNWT